MNAPTVSSISSTGTMCVPGIVVSRVSCRMSRKPTATATMLARMVTHAIDSVTSRSEVSISGPGSRPTIRNALSSTAVAAPPGIPNATVGIRAPLSLALLDAPAAMTPSTEPMPNLSGYLEVCWAWPYARNWDTDPPTPGTMPTPTPIALERTTSHQWVKVSRTPWPMPDRSRDGEPSPASPRQ